MQKQKGRTLLACAAWVSVVGCLATSAGAHTLPISFLTLVPDADYLHLELSFNPFELTFYAELDRNHNGRVEPSEWDVAQTNVARRLLNCLTVRVAGNAMIAEVAGITPDLDSHHVTLRAHYRVDARNVPVAIESSLINLTSGSHVTQATFGKEGRQQRARLDAQAAIARFEPWETGGRTIPVQEPNPLTPSLSPSGGEGARRAGEGAAHFRVSSRESSLVDSLPNHPSHTTDARSNVWPWFVLAGLGLALGVVLLIRGQIFLSQRAPRCCAAVANDPLKNSS